MTNSIKEYILESDTWKMRGARLLNAIFFKKTFCFLSLRLGTVLIALTELLMTTFVIFLLLLGVTHSQEMLSLVSSKIEHLEESDFRLRNFHDAFFYFNNENRLLKGQHLANVVSIVLLAALVFATIHVLSCLMLLFAAVRRVAFLVVPWVIIVVFTMFSSLVFLVMFVFFPMDLYNKLIISATIVIFMVYEIYAWLAVINFYRETLVT